MGEFRFPGFGPAHRRTVRAALLLAAAFALVWSASSVALHPATAAFQPLAVSESSNSHLTVWGPDGLKPPSAGGQVTATARLVDFSEETRGDPLAGRTITFSLGSDTQDAITDASGEASATFTYAPGQTDVIVASFAGDGTYSPSMDRGWLRGDIVIGVGNGMAHRYDSAGNFINVFDSTTGSLETAGMCFDSSHNLYMTNFQERVISKFDRTTGEVIPEWASGFSASPESCVLGRENLDADPELEDVIYAGEQDGLNYIRKFNTDGVLLDTFDVASGNRGADWIDLRAGGTSLRYTSEGSEIFAYDLAADTQLPSFVPDQSVPANQLVPRADSLPVNAIDGNTDTSWITNDGEVANEFITIDLAGDVQRIDRVYIEGHDETTAIKSFQVQVSTTGTADTDFSTVLTGVSPQDTTGKNFNFAAVNAKFVRLIAVDNHGSAILLRVDEFRVLSTTGVNVAAAAGGAAIAGASSIQRDPLLPKPCFAIRNRPDGSALVTCASEVVHISADGLEALHRYSRAALGFGPTDTVYGLNLGLDGESFWVSSQVEGRVAHVDLDTGAVLQSFVPVKRGPIVGGLAVFGEPTEGVNYEPAAFSQSVIAESGEPLAITLSGDDPESEPLTFTVVNPPDNGNLTGASPEFTYRSDPGFTGADSFTFIAFDGELYSAPATVSIDVQQAGGPPAEGAGGPYVVTEGATVSLDGSGAMDGSAALYEWDLDGDGMFGETGAGAANGDETGVSPVFDAASLDGPGLVTVMLRATGAGGATSTSQANVTVDNAAPSVSVTGGVAQQGGSATVGVTFTDPAAMDTHSAAVDWGDGSAVEELGPVTSPFDAAHTYAGTGNFTVSVTITDDDGGTGTAGAIVVVGEPGAPGNEAPVALSQSVSVQQDRSLQITLTGIDADLGQGESLAFSVLAQPSHGSLSAVFHAGPTVALAIYTPVTGYVGPDSFEFAVTDGYAVSVPATVSISVVGQSSGGSGGGGGGGVPAPTATPQPATASASTPGSMQTVSAEPGDRLVTLSWSAPLFDGGSPVIGYRILVLNTSDVRFAWAPATSTEITGLENGIDYFFQVQAFNAAGYGPSVVAGPATPAGLASPPLYVQAGLEADGSVRVTWSAPESDGGSEITGYTVNLDDGTEAVSAPAWPLSVKLEDLAPGFAYSFIVTAVTAAGRGEPSAPSLPLFLPDLPAAPDDVPPVTSTPEPAAVPTHTPAATASPEPSPTASPVPSSTSTPVPLPLVEPTPFVLAEAGGGGASWVAWAIIAAGMAAIFAVVARMLARGITRSLQRRV